MGQDSAIVGKVFIQGHRQLRPGRPLTFTLRLGDEPISLFPSISWQGLPPSPTAPEAAGGGLPQITLSQATVPALLP